MLALRIVDIPEDESSAVEQRRVAKRTRVLMRANMRVPTTGDEHALTIRNISSTGLLAAGNVSLFSGTRVEVDLPNIGWMAGEIVWHENGVVGVHFAAIIQPERTLSEINGNFGPAPSKLSQPLRRV